MIGTIYALAEPDTQNVRYCGKTTRKIPHRMNGHRRDARQQPHRHLYYWLRKVYDSGKEPVVMICEELDLGKLPRSEQLRLLNETETRWIHQFKVLGFDLTNATNGGDGCHGRAVSEETRKKAADSNRGKKRSAEACDRIRAAAIQRPLSCYVRGETHPHFGKKQEWEDPEARAAKIRAAWDDPEKRLAHGAEHNGEANGNSRITVETALSIYQDQRSYSQIADDHKTNIKMVSDIKNGITWRHVTAHDPMNRRTKYKINAEIAQQIYLAAGSQRSIAKRFGVSNDTVAEIKSGRRWSEATQLIVEGIQLWRE